MGCIAFPQSLEVNTTVECLYSVAQYDEYHTFWDEL